jgi:8-oxo-dGTP pyrophosphatase MutT (NUDIX family)
MSRELLLKDLEQYRSLWCLPEEHAALAQFIDFVTKNENCFERSHVGHVTSSVWILNHAKTHVLLTHHKKLNMWIQLGGHNDGDSNCLRVALKEAQEESGIETLIVLKPEIFDIDIHPIPNKCAYHYDVRYVLQAPQDAQYKVSEESHDLAWVPLHEIAQVSPFRSVIRMQEKSMRLR